VNVYINLQGREAGGIVSREEYLELQEQIAEALRDLLDSNPNYAPGRAVRVFDQIHQRPTPLNLASPEFGLSTNNVIGQDSGDVFAVLRVGYNFDGIQTPVVQRLGDASAQTPVLSVPNFYGAHGYDPRLPEMSAIFFAAGPDVCRQRLESVRNIDVAPTILDILNVRPGATVQGHAIRFCSDDRDGRDRDGRDDDNHRKDDGDRQHTSQRGR
jgi:predicted AlkP superfamily phosphohydrolase/phosphomutase